MKLGIVGLPNVGKSTLFNAIMRGRAESANYHFSTINPNVGVVPVPDPRLAVLEEMYQAKVVTPAVVEMVDIAGLVEGASQGEGMGNQFLSHIREVDAIVHVVRGFEDENITHVYEEIDPLRDIEIINLELIISDLEVVERRLSKSGKANKNDKIYHREADVLKILQAAFMDGTCARHINWENPDDAKYVESLNMLTGKPVLYAVNVLENEIKEENLHVKNVEAFAEKEGSKVFSICAKIEEEIALLDAEEKEMFLQELGLEQGGLDRLIAAGYELLGLISFLTAGPKEVRAWTIRQGTKAPQAAGKIHSDLERGFIRAEVVDYEDLNRLGSYNKAKESGLVRVEGKEYIVKDGDVVLVRFNV
ncbi:MAG: redox-regulated ATPase YchF [Defluviitaleaceae bacterium]|nr:redox-regulated ATPase YchF [Defluviitaleaceae bacterium]